VCAWLFCLSASAPSPDIGFKNVVKPKSLQRRAKRNWANLLTSYGCTSVQREGSLSAAARSLRASSAVRVVPVQRPGLAIERAGLQRAIVDAGHRGKLGVVGRREDLVRILEVRVGQGRLRDRHAGAAQQRDHALARDAVEKGTVRHR